MSVQVALPVFSGASPKQRKLHEALHATPNQTQEELNVALANEMVPSVVDMCLKMSVRDNSVVEREGRFSIASAEVQTLAGS